MSEVVVASNVKTGESVYFMETGYAADLGSFSSPAVTIGNNYYRLTRTLIEGAFEGTIEGRVFSEKVRLYSQMDVEGKQVADEIMAGKIKDRVLDLLGDDYRIGLESGDAKNFSDTVRENVDSIVETEMNSLREIIGSSLKKIAPPSRELANA